MNYSCGCAQIGALFMQIIKPVRVCLSYSDKEYPLKIEYLEIRRKMKRIILYSVHKKLSDDAQLPSIVIQTCLTGLHFGRQ